MTRLYTLNKTAQSAIDTLDIIAGPQQALYVVFTIDKKGRKMAHYFDNYDAAETAHREFRNHPLCESSEFDVTG